MTIITMAIMKPLADGGCTSKSSALRKTLLNTLLGHRITIYWPTVLEPVMGKIVFLKIVFLKIVFLKIVFYFKIENTI